MPICVNESMFTRTQDPWRIDAVRNGWRLKARRIATLATAIGAGVATFAALPVMGASAATTSTGTEVSTVTTPYGTVLKAGSGQFAGLHPLRIHPEHAERVHHEGRPGEQPTPVVHRARV